MKTLHELFGDFYSPEHVLSYGRKWICCIGSRHIGKSTGWMIYLLFRYIRYGERFVYIRRDDDTAKMTAKTAFNGACIIMREGGWPVFSVTAKTVDKIGTFYLQRTADAEPEEIGHFIGLNLSDKLKSADLGDMNYKWILYDEFISLDRTRYLGSSKNFLFEYIKADELYETIDRKVGHARLGECHFIFISNSASYYNPIFLGLGIDLYITTDAKTIAPKGAKWICEQTRSVKATQNIQHDAITTEIQKRLAAYNYENMAFDDSPAFVEKISEPMNAICSVVYQKHKMGVYLLRDGRVYICNKPTQLQTIALTADDTSGGINYFLLQANGMRDYINLIKDRFYQGQIVYQTQKIKYEISNFMMKIPY